ncbi:MAG: HDOD domain-containing protein [Gammaproteobacteria bacterium]|nr:HDOD domain-containing protein [Gammaproteobacteria bacterium]
MHKQAIRLLQKTDIHKLPTLPHVLVQLLETCQDENVSFDKLANIIQNDPALCVKVISSCGNECTSLKNLEKQLSRLGINTIKSIAITSAVHQFFSRSSQQRMDFLKRHWRHSIYCGCVAEQLAQLTDYQHTGEAWFAGLLHDAGQLVMESAYPDRYTAELTHVDEDENVHTMESDQLDTTHCHVGAQLFVLRDGHPFLADAIMYHHEPITKILDAHPLVKIINLANLISHDNYRDNTEQAHNAARQLFGLPADLIEKIRANCDEKIGKIAEKFGIATRDIDIDNETIDKIMSTDQLKQVKLAEQIRDIAMLDGVHQHFSRIDGKRALLKALQQNIAVLFGINDCILFLYDAADDKIQATSTTENDPHLQHISIPLEPGRSIVTDALLEMRAIHSFNKDPDNLSILDCQLIDLNNKEGLFCMPLIVHNAAIGTLLLGIDEAQLPALSNQQGLLKRFANEIARTISTSLAEFRNQREDHMGIDPEKFLKARAREVIHEVRNPLTIINNYLEILGIQLEGDDPAQQDLATIRAEIQRISTMLENLAQPISVEADISESVPVDVNGLIADLSHMFQTSLFGAHDIDISLNLDESMPPISTNADAIKQIYTNLVKNAVEALPAEGQIMVYTQDQVNVDGKAHFEICVADDGPGIPAKILPDLFSPVTTTKGEGHAGLGLTIVKNLVNELHGSISCRSSDKGTSFHILLPRNIQE